MNAETRPMGSAVALRLPADARELRDLATFISTSRLIPQHFQKSPADCWMVMDFCREKGLNFFATIGHCSIVRNNLFFDGQLCGALLNISGFLADHINHEIERDKNGKPVAVITSARLRNETMPRSVRVELERVKTENKVWTTQPEQQLCYSGNRIWGRRFLPEVLLGMTFEGETIDITPNPIEPRNVPVNLPTNDNATASGNLGLADAKEAWGAAKAVEEEVKAHADEAAATSTTFNERRKAEPTTIPLRADTEKDWSQWATMLIAYVRAAPDIATVYEWQEKNSENLQKLEHTDKTKHAKLTDMIRHNVSMRAEQDEAQ